MASAFVMVKQTEKPWNKIGTDINEDTKKAEDLAIIKDWLKKQPHLPNEWDEICLLSFLTGCNYSLERCKKKLDMYFTMKTACPEFFTNRDITRPELMDIMSKGYGSTMPGLTADGRRISISKAIDYSLDPRQLTDLFKIIMMIGDIRLRDPTPGVTGEVYVIDAEILKPSHLLKLSPTLLKKFLICIQESYPVRLKEVHIINTSTLVDAVFSILRPFMKEKMKNRVHFHKDYTTLHEYIPNDILPTDFGGTNGSLEEVHCSWLEKLKEFGAWFKEQETVKANEAMRPGNPTNYDELFGIDGSFKKLAID